MAVRGSCRAQVEQPFEWVASALTDNERRFLLSIKQDEPDWSLLPFEGLDRWPAIQWKLRNIQLMNDRRHEAAIRRLRKILGAWAVERCFVEKRTTG